jgi:MFS family permease
MVLTASQFTVVFWVAVVPAVLSVAVLMLGVHDPDRPAEVKPVRTPLSRTALARLGPAYWGVVAVATVFTLARFSEAFLILRAQSIGLPVALVPAVLVVKNVVYAVSSWPAGVWSDRVDRVRVAGAGLAVLIVADLVLAFWGTIAGVAMGVALWGLHVGLTQGLLARLVADAAPAELRGTAFGMCNLIAGLATLAASVVAGAVWDAVGPPGTFRAGATFTALALLALPVSRLGRHAAHHVVSSTGAKTEGP